jgi:hypothetical protein
MCDQSLFDHREELQISRLPDDAPSGSNSAAPENSMSAVKVCRILKSSTGQKAGARRVTENGFKLIAAWLSINI